MLIAAIAVINYIQNIFSLSLLSLFFSHWATFFAFLHYYLFDLVHFRSLSFYSLRFAFVYSFSVFCILPLSLILLYIIYLFCRLHLSHYISVPSVFSFVSHESPPSPLHHPFSFYRFTLLLYACRPTEPLTCLVRLFMLHFTESVLTSTLTLLSKWLQSSILINHTRGNMYLTDINVIHHMKIPSLSLKNWDFINRKCIIKSYN